MQQVPVPAASGMRPAKAVPKNCRLCLCRDRYKYDVVWCHVVPVGYDDWLHDADRAGVAGDFLVRPGPLQLFFIVHLQVPLARCVEADETASPGPRAPGTVPASLLQRRLASKTTACGPP